MFAIRWLESGRNDGQILRDALWVRAEVFLKEQKFSHDEDELDQTSIIAVCYDGDSPVGTGRLIRMDGDAYRIGRVAVLESYRGREIGRLLMESLEQRAVRLGAREVHVAAQVRAGGFYRKIGYAEYGEEYYDEYCPHIWMKKIPEREVGS